MNLSMNDIMNLSFDEPLEYKKVLLYPATMKDYMLFSVAEECLDVSRIDEKDKRLLRLPYLDYLYEKSLLEDTFKIKWNILLGVLNIVFGDKQFFEIIKKDNCIYIKVYQRSDNYELLNKEYTKLSSGKKKEELRKQMYNEILINSEDFENIRQLIMIQNDIKSQHYPEKVEKYLYEIKEKMKATKPSDIDIEDTITLLSYFLHIENKDIKNMTIRRFNRKLQIALNKDDYYLYKQLELSGNIKFKSELPHWFTHYKPKGKFDDVLINANNMMSSLMNGGKI